MKKAKEILKKNMNVKYCNGTRFSYLDEDEVPLILNAMEEYASLNKIPSKKDFIKWFGLMNVNNPKLPSEIYEFFSASAGNGA